jgi:glycosyltransferase involved in cell wall biosynthesis
MKLISVIIPCYNEAEGLSLLADRLDHLVKKLSNKVQVEVIMVDDHSTDGTHHQLRELCAQRTYMKFIRFSRNSGSHVAIVAGMKYAKGDAAVFLAADLQDPPELVVEMIDKWEKGFDVIWAVRTEREGVSRSSVFLSNMFYRLLNSMTDIRFPKKGADYAFLDRKVINGLVQSAGSKPSLGALISWLGFMQTEIPYVKEARKFGKSKWTLSKKLNAFAEAFVGFSYLPMRFMSLIGFIAAFCGFIYALIVVIFRFVVGDQIEGWASLMVVILIIGGLQMIMLGVLGEYLWRNLEESRRRPLFLIEDQKGIEQ